MTIENHPAVESQNAFAKSKTQCFDCLHGYDHLNIGKQNPCPSAHGITYEIRKEGGP